ncbi:MAG TPA: hypothetical protein VJQ58_08005, partial [Burkholderiales bacterium]|nr:hypothetical protein [Burkholderiales bacterium]
MKGPLLTVLLLTGCSSHTSWHASAGQPHPHPHAQLSGAAAVAFIGLAVIANGSTYDARATPFTGLGESRRPPEM